MLQWLFLMQVSVKSVSLCICYGAQIQAACSAVGTCSGSQYNRIFPMELDQIIIIGTMQHVIYFLTSCTLYMEHYQKIRIARSTVSSDLFPGIYLPLTHQLVDSYPGGNPKN